MSRQPYTGAPLSDRELYVLQRAALGDTYLRTARLLYLSPSQVQHAARRAITKIGARSLTHAVVVAIDCGLIHPGDCGTVRTYYWHLRHSQVPDTGCTAAYLDGERRKYHDRRKEYGGLR
jgi:DNA-binding CsgD family transcriptional regulator